MIVITYKNTIRGKTPEQLYNLFLNLTPEQHRQMHPQHHKEWRVIKRTGGVGTIVYGHEEFEGFTFKGHAVVSEAQAGKLIAYRSKQRFLPLLMSFSFHPTDTGTKLVSTIKIGYEGGFWNIIDWLVRRFYLTDRLLGAHQRHVDEEFKYLETM